MKKITSNNYSRKQLANIIRKIDSSINFTGKKVEGNKVTWKNRISFDNYYYVVIELDKYGLWMYYNTSNMDSPCHKFCTNEREIQAFINQIKKYCVTSSTLSGGLAPDVETVEAVEEVETVENVAVGGLDPDVEDVEDVEEAEYVEDVEVGGLDPDEDKDFHRKWHDMLIRQTPIKVYESINSNSMYYVGATINIKAIYKSIARCKSSNTSLAPAYCDAPVFSSRKSVYGLAVNYDENTFQIVNSDTIMLMILHGGIKEC